MRRFLKFAGCVFSGAAVLALNGCVTNQQLIDFGRTEVARAIADVFGRIVQLYTQAT